MSEAIQASHRVNSASAIPKKHPQAHHELLSTSLQTPRALPRRLGPRRQLHRDLFGGHRGLWAVPFEASLEPLQEQMWGM